LGFFLVKVGVRLGFIANIIAVFIQLLADVLAGILAMLGFSRGGHFGYREGAASRAPFSLPAPASTL